MKRLIEYFYYRCYDFLCIFKSFDIHFAALHLMSILSSIVILDLLFFAFQFNNELTLFNNIIFGMSYLIPLVFYYFIVFRNEKYFLIIEKYKDEPKRINLLGKTIISFLIVFLISMIFVFKVYFFHS